MQQYYGPSTEYGLSQHGTSSAAAHVVFTPSVVRLQLQATGSWRARLYLRGSPVPSLALQFLVMVVHGGRKKGQPIPRTEIDRLHFNNRHTRKKKKKTGKQRYGDVGAALVRSGISSGGFGSYNLHCSVLNDLLPFFNLPLSCSIFSLHIDRC
jgi:hypothetical protein